MDSELKWRVESRTRELEEANQALRRSQETLAQELDAARRLQQVATELISTRGTEDLQEQILDTAMAILHADFASIQKFCPERGGAGELHLLGTRGMDPEVVKGWEWIAPTRCTGCAMALRTRKRVVIQDIRKCEFLAGTEELKAYHGAGINAVQTTPLISRSGEMLGMVSTHWRQPHELSESEARTLDVLARLAADLMERSLAEDRLRESEERFRTLADAAPVMIWVTDPDKQATFFNKRCLDYSGRSMQEKVGDGWVAGLHPDDRDRYLQLYSESIDARRDFRAVIRLRGGDGRYGWVLCSGVPRFLADGVFAGFIGSCIEITDQKLIEEGLRASEVRLMAAQHLAHVGSWERHVDGSAVHWSAELLLILGITSAAPPDLAAFLAYVHPKDRGKVLELDGRIRATPEPIEAEYRIVRPGGEVRFVRAALEAIRDHRGVPVRITEAIQDITEQVRAREELRESEQHLRNAERLAQVGHFQWDVRTNCVTGSEEMYRIFGKPPDFVPSYETFLEDLNAADRERMGRLIQESLERRTGNSMEYQITHPGGDVRTISCIWEVLVDEEGAPVRLFGTCQDITESRRAQEESFARQKLETLGTLASGIAHDFNNLLGGVLAQADLALTECGAGGDPRPELNSIRNVAVRGSEIVRQLMTYAGQRNAAVEPVDVSEIVREMLELLKFSVSKRATLETQLGDELPAIAANPAQLRQVVMNLVMNASDALGDRDGVIRVTTRLAKVAAEWTGNGTSETDRLILEVCDTGRGMAPETQAKVFDPFFTTKAAGHGMGLAVVQGIVRSLGGTVVVRSEPEKGAAFQVLLPAVKTAAAGNEAASRVEPAPSAISGAHVLFVEDETFLREAIARMLRKSGYEVWEAADGVSAINLIHAHHPRIDVILLDATIPGASSQEIVAEAAKVRPDIRVILTSAYGRERIAGALAAPQVREFIRKPFPFEDLVKTLRKTLSA